MSTNYKIKVINSTTFIDDILIVNKKYSLPKSYVPRNPYLNILNKKSSIYCVEKEVFEAFYKMKNCASLFNLNIWIQSGYRSYAYQKALYESYRKSYGDLADTFSAKPGYSEHQTGLAIDLNSITNDFENTNEGQWVNNNAYKYGFIIRYPKGKEHVTGYKYEPWHLRYVGIELATNLYNNGNWITLEEYFDL